jgi:2,4-dienoyl-CoA reductase-like NADH-dependent reductase (Old Yellow Enzyme family)/thioredoxin reductase
MSPMGTYYAETDGRFSPKQIDYLGERAKGGAGMIIPETVFAVRPDGNLLYVGDDTSLPALVEITDICHTYGAKICAQMGCGLGRNSFMYPGAPQPTAPSAIPNFYDPSILCRPLENDEIKEIVASYGPAARRIAAAGFDCIEVHGHTGYLIDQFMTPLWNKRTDEYGGSMENRVRFPVEIVKEIRGAVGPDYPILFRISVDHKFPGGRTLEDSLPLVKSLEQAGVDAFDIDAGCYDAMQWIFPPSYLGDSCMLDLAAAVKKIVSVPVLNSGNHTPDSALEAVEAGSIDFVMMGRQFLADPDLPNKLALGTTRDIRPCLRCNDGCHRAQGGVGCAVNIQAARERVFNIEKTRAPKKVAVIGGGPSGLEAARVAALKGHQVTLYEKSDNLGGQMRPAATPSFKRLSEFIKWYEYQMEKLNVTVKYGCTIKADSPELESADQVVIAVGASPLIVPISGIDGKNVINVIDAHLYPERVKGDTIIVAGGGLSGADYALEAAHAGRKVKLVEMRDRIIQDCNFYNMGTLRGLLEQEKVEILTSHRVIKIDDQGIIAETGGKEVRITGDVVVAAFGSKANRAQAEALRANLPNRRIAGDCNEIGNIHKAVYAGFGAGFSTE